MKCICVLPLPPPFSHGQPDVDDCVELGGLDAAAERDVGAGDQCGRPHWRRYRRRRNLRMFNDSCCLMQFTVKTKLHTVSRDRKM